MSDNPETTGTKEGPGSEGTQFKPGVSGNPAGRPKGSRHELGGDFIRGLQTAFTKGGQKAIDEVMKKSPAKFLVVLASILPKELKVTTDHIEDMSPEDVRRRIAHLSNILNIGEGVPSSAGEGEEGRGRKPAKPVPSLH